MTGIANTNSLNTNFNVDPYYDDFNETKNFHRILFRPGFAVQARELTQLQTILQNQIDRFAEHIFKEGSTVRGLEMNYDSNIEYVKIKDNDQNGTAITVEDFEGLQITGGTSGLVAEVVDSLPGTEGDAPDTKILYIKYKNSGTDNTTKRFSSGELLTSNSTPTANVITGLANTVTNTGSRITFGAGIIYAKDHFIRVPEQSIIVGRNSSNATYKIGYDITESEVTYLEDETLLDPAQGAYNYAAPGADRLKLQAVLVKKELADTNIANFVEKVRINKGVVDYKADKPAYSVINDYIARRTYDESGNYIVNGLNVRAREHLNSSDNGGVFTLANGGDSDKLSIDVSPGKAYVKGYELENVVTRHVVTDKGIDFTTANNVTVSTVYGNYVIVDEVVGTWDINTHDRVDLYDTAQNAISSSDFSAKTIAGSKIGEARVRHLEYVSAGNPTKGAYNARYYLYLYDINMTGGSFSSVRSIYYNDLTHDGIADCVLENGNAVLKETAFNTSVWTIPANNIRTLVDTSFQFLVEKTATTDTAGTFSILGSAGDELFIGSGLLSASQKRELFTVISRGTATTSTIDSSVNRSFAANTITNVDSATDRFNVGDVVQLGNGGTDANNFIVSGVSGTTLNLIGPTSTKGPAQSSVNIKKVFLPGQIIAMEGKGGSGGDRTINVTSPTTAAFDFNEPTLSAGIDVSVICEMNKSSATQIEKVLNPDRYVQIRISDNTANTVGPWNLGISDIFELKEVRFKTGNTLFSTASEGTDVTNQFILDSGMRDNLYDHGKLKLKSSATHTVSNGNVYLVKFDYFSHNTSVGKGYFTVDSYPIDDVNIANTTAITTAEIPRYESPTTGALIDLRNAIDIRPRITDVASDSTTVGGATTNPATSTVVVAPSGGLRYAAPNEQFTTDFQYYLPRKDRIVYTERGTFRVIKGVPSLNPRIPEPPSDGMTIAIVNIMPYPSLPQENAKKIGRTDLAIKIDPIRIRRYTMQDIQTLEKRIDTLEYYTSLSLLETQTKNIFLDNGSGIDRFKNGIIVDQFIDFSISDFYSEDFKIAIDKSKKELRPSFKLDDAQLEYSSGGQLNGKLITLPILSHDKVIEQPTATSTRNAAGLFYTYIGNISLTPETDYWQDITTAPSVNIEFGNIAEALEQVANHVGIQWGSWNNVGGRRLTSQTTNITQRNVFDPIFGTQGTQRSQTTTSTFSQTIQRQGQQLTVQAGELNETNLGDSVQNVSIIPYMRSRQIQFTAQGLKPNTRIYAFFDGEDVNEYCAPANSAFSNTASEGSALITDSNGVLYGLFRIPNDENKRFLTGNLKFRLTDSSTNSSLVGAVTTSAEATYSSKGLDIVTQGTIISTRDIDVNTRTLSETSTITSSQTSTVDLGTTFRFDTGAGEGGGDPIAQTFRVSDGNGINSPGAFLTKIELFFSSKDANQPVIIEIREVDPSTNYVTNNVVPFSRKVVPASSINTSADGSAGTLISFDTPVYLFNDVDYAFVVIPADNNPNVSLFVARLGETDLITGNRIVENPFVGTLFASANDRVWTPIQEEDLKFALYFANFGTNQSATITMTNIAREYLQVDEESGRLSSVGEPVHGETTLNLASNIGGLVGQTLVDIGNGANGTITFTNGSGQYRVKTVTLNNKFITSNTITLYQSGVATANVAVLNSQSTPTAKVYFYDNTTQANTIVHLSDPSGSFTANTYIRGQFSGDEARIVSVDNLALDTFKLFSSKFELQDTITSSTARFASTPNALDATFRPVNINEDTEFDARKYILSRSNEVANISGNKSATVRFAISNSSNERHSPAFDTDRASVVTIENLINDATTGSVGEDGAGGGNAKARYIQRTITLADGQDAEDLKVYIAAYKPSTADIKIYVKLLNGEDGDTIENKNWIELSQVTSSAIYSDSENSEDFKEYEFELPLSVMTGGNGEVQYTTGGVTYTGYKRFKIKIALFSSSTTKVPRVKDFRAIALQI